MPHLISKDSPLRRLPMKAITDFEKLPKKVKEAWENLDQETIDIINGKK